MADEPMNLSVRILKEIRDEIRRTNGQLVATNERIDATNERQSRNSRGGWRDRSSLDFLFLVEDRF